MRDVERPYEFVCVYDYLVLVLICLDLVWGLVLPQYRFKEIWEYSLLKVFKSILPRGVIDGKVIH